MAAEPESSLRYDFSREDLPRLVTCRALAIAQPRRPAWFRDRRQDRDQDFLIAGFVCFLQKISPYRKKSNTGEVPQTERRVRIFA